MKQVPMDESKDSTSIAQSIATSESCSEYSLVDSYDAQVAYKHDSGNSKYAQALEKKSKARLHFVSEPPARKTTANF
mgnify:CR=1 FL=1